MAKENMKKLLLILLTCIAIYFISWLILGKEKLFEKEYSFIKKQEYYINDDKAVYLIHLEYNYFEGYGFYDSLSISTYTNKKVDTRMIDENSGKSFIAFKVSGYNPFFIKSTKSYWIYGTDGVFDFSTKYTWFFIDWVQLSETKYN
jgi:hypothetical protein